MLTSTSLQNLNSNSMYSRLQKKDKSSKISRFENVYCSSCPDLQICPFCRTSNTTNLDINFCTVVNLIIIYIQNFCFHFFETIKYHFRKIQRTSSMELGSNMSMLDELSLLPLQSLWVSFGNSSHLWSRQNKLPQISTSH
jgi:hypothetical protein